MKRQRRSTWAPPPEPVSAREFIKAWQESESLAEVAMKVRSKKNACRVRAYRYRLQGVPLKEFEVIFAEPPDWDELSEYAALLLPDDEARRKAGWVVYDNTPENDSARDAEMAPANSLPVRPGR